MRIPLLLFVSIGVSFAQIPIDIFRPVQVSAVGYGDTTAGADRPEGYLGLIEGTVQARPGNPGGAVSVAERPSYITPNLPIILTPSSAGAGTSSVYLDVIPGQGGFQFDLHSTIYWNGSPLPTTNGNLYALYATIPGNLLATPGTATVTVNTQGVFSAPATFQILATTLSSVIPPSATAGGPDFALSVFGAGFVAGSTVLWNGSALTTSFVSATKLSASVPASLIALPGTDSITVQIAGGPLVGPLSFKIDAPTPVISTLNPSFATAGGTAFTLVVGGTGFLPGYTILWNGTALSTTYVNGLVLTGTVPAALYSTPGTVSVAVQSPSGNSNSKNFTVVAPHPTITALSPSTVTAGGPAFTLTITGTGFVAGAISYLNGTPLSTTFVSSTSLTAVVPASAINGPGNLDVNVVNPDGSQSPVTPAIAITGVPAPYIGGLSPWSASAGGPAFTLSVQGLYFVSGSTVWGNGSALATTYVSATQLNAAVPASLIASVGTASFKVSVPDGRSSNVVTLTIAAPYVDYLGTTGTFAGSPAFTLSVAGKYFFAGSTVQWNGSALTTNSSQASGSSVRDWLTASVPANLIASPGTASVTVVNPGGATSNAVTFTIIAPSITKLYPQSITAGGPAFALAVEGGSYFAGSTVQWNGSALSTSTYMVGSTLLNATVPASLIASPGTANITVVNPGGVTTNALVFTINPGAPTITSLSPTSVTAGGQAFSLGVNGSGFLPGSIVLWNSSGLGISTFYVGGNGNQLTASIPATFIATAGTASITVKNPDGTTSSPVTLTITAPTPRISGLNPNSATAGGPAFTLTVYGSGFLSGSSAQWNGSAVSTTYVSATQLTASIPANLIAAQGAATVTVANPAGAVSNSASFTTNAATPVISALAPNSATAGGQQFTLTVFGSGFLSGSTVQWNGSLLPTTYGSGSQLTATVSAALIANAGSASIAVVNQAGAASAGSTFTINPAAPSISGLSPNSAIEAGPAFTLVVNGSGFLSGSVVQWNGNWNANALTTTYVNGSQLSAAVPANLISVAGNAGVQVVNPDAQRSAPATFTISPNAAGHLTVTTPSPLPAGTVGVPYSQPLAATGGFTPYKSWTAVDPNNLPPGISVSMGPVPGTAALTGTPMAIGMFMFSVQVTDAAGTTATTWLTVTINSGALSITTAGIVNSASYAGGSVAPGEMVTIFGSGFGPDALANLQLDERGYVSTSLADTQVLFDGTAAPLIYSVAGQVSAIVPYAVAGKSRTQVQVTYKGQMSNLVSVPVATAVPGIFTADASGHGQGSIVNQDGTINSAANPAPVGSIISVYATGEGQTSPDGVDGKPADWPAPLPVAQPVTAMVRGMAAEVQYAGGAPGAVAGFLQVNVQIPQGISPGSAVPITISVGGRTSQANVTVAIQ